MDVEVYSHTECYAAIRKDGIMQLATTLMEIKGTVINEIGQKEKSRYR